MSLTVFCWVSWHRITVDQYTCIWAAAERYELESFNTATTHCCKAGISKLTSTARQIEENRDKTSVPERAVYRNMRNGSQQRTREEWNTVKIKERLRKTGQLSCSTECLWWIIPKNTKYQSPNDFAGLSSPCVLPWHIPCSDTCGEDQHNRRLWPLELQFWWEHRASKHWGELTKSRPIISWLCTNYVSAW